MGPVDHLQGPVATSGMFCYKISMLCRVPKTSPKNANQDRKYAEKQEKCTKDMGLYTRFGQSYKLHTVTIGFRDAILEIWLQLSLANVI